jgi:trk system potassium uptake protein TrkA
MRIIIIGCGRMGAGLAKTLNQRGHQIFVIDRDPASFERLGTGFKGHTLAGVGFDREVLLKAGIKRADALAALTSSDDANVITARLASQIFRVPRVVARLYDPLKAEIYLRLGVQTIDTIAWGVNRTADLLCHSELDILESLGNGEVDLIHIEIPPSLIRRTVKDLTVHGEIHVIAITRGGKAFLPTANTEFQAEDTLYLAITPAAGDRLRGLLGLN